MANTGFRIFTRINRPAPDLIEAFRAVPVANIGDSMNRAPMLDARIRRIGKVNLAGPAFTVKSRAGDNLMLHKALDMAQPGDVIVFDGHGDLTSAITGELMMQTAIERKLAVSSSTVRSAIWQRCVIWTCRFLPRVSRQQAPTRMVRARLTCRFRSAVSS